MTKLIKNPNELRTPLASKPMTQVEIDDISTKLLNALTEHGGIGLSANQIGLEVRACVINVKEPLVLINPKVTEASKDTVAYVEQCLSLDKTMKKPVKTVRHKTFTVECDNLGTVIFSNDSNEWKDSNEFFADEGLLECVCAQHEIDHLNGVLITDKVRRYTTTVTAPKKYGRNERVMVKLLNGDTEFMKYKKAEPMIALGAEIL
jgi:peptide deformylase|tara:strand:+ start:2523 stop:3137 length:615 start_codon:yes stop_codon:yes gene_type:complete